MIQNTHPGTTIRDIQAEIARALEAIPTLDRKGKLPEELRPLVHYLSAPPGRTPVVMLKNQKRDRKVRETASADYWDLNECVALIQFEETEEGASTESPPLNWDFNPVRILGEPLSSTIVSQRR